MGKKITSKDSKKRSLNKKIEQSIYDAKEFLMKEKEYEEYLKRIEKLSRGVYNM